jgi:predicted transcriptional regulator
MLFLTQLRGNKSQAWLAGEAQVPQPVLSWVESGRFTPYPPQLARLAAALAYQGKPGDLLAPVDDEDE